jgi:hypothetical protein
MTKNQRFRLTVKLDFDGSELYPGEMDADVDVHLESDAESLAVVVCQFASENLESVQ